MNLWVLMKRVLRWMGLALALLAMGLVLFALDSTGRLLGRVVGMAGTALFVLSIITMLLTFRTAKRLSPLALSFGALVSLATTLGFHLWAGAPTAPLVLALATLGGVLVGAGWSLTSLLFVDPATTGAGGVRARGDLWFLAVWAATLVLPQIVAHAGARTPAALTLLSFLGMGLAIGNGGGLMLRTWAALRDRHSPTLREVRP
jgi:hypothetical protein